MNNKLTICFYEYPAALHEIEAWEKTQDHRIVAKKTSPDNKIKFLLNAKSKDDKDEILICYPHQYLNKFFIDELRLLITNGEVYHKTLIFGKFNSKQLRHIAIIIEQFEDASDN